MNAVITEIPALAHDAGVPPAPPEAHQQAGEERLIPLRRLVASPFNVRRAKRTGLQTLAANIEHVGLLQNLVVHPMKVGAKRAQTYGVAAGESRRLAMLELVERGSLSLDTEVRCLVVSTDAAVLISTSENVTQHPMHPADQCDAFRALVDSGRSIPDVAAIYAISETMVRQRLKLARVSPKLIELFRNNEIRLDVMQALSTSTQTSISTLSTGLSSNMSAIASLSTGTGQSVSTLTSGLGSANSNITALQTGLSAGTIGVVQQAGGASTGTIMVGAGTGGTAVDVSGTAGARQIQGVAAGTSATDAVNLQQLQSMTSAMGSAAGAVGYVDASHSRVVLGAVGTPVTVTNVADGALSSGSTDAVSGRQLYAANQAIAANATAIGNLSTATAATLSSLTNSTAQSLNSLSTDVSSNQTTLSALQTGLAAGTVGLVRQASGLATGTIAIGAGTGGTAINVAGTAGARQLKGVAAGTGATDAVNLQQLDDALSAVGPAGAGSIGYDDASRTRVTFGGAGTPVALTNIADAALSPASTDAVTGRQLFATNQSVSALAGQLAAGTVGLVQQVGGTTAALAIGAGTAGSSIDVAGTAGPRRITGVAAGVDVTDAANVGQLQQLAGAVGTLASSALAYDGPTKLSVTLGGLGAGTAVTIHNLAAGALSAGSLDAVNGGQLFATNQILAANTAAITSLSSQLGAILPSSFSQTNAIAAPASLKYAAFNSAGAGAVATGTDAVAIGATAVASGERAVSLGAGAASAGTGSVALGDSASAKGANSVALGAGSVADQDNAVSIGNAATGMTRILSNVSPGVAPTDAVNVQQLNDSVTGLANQIEHDRRDANGGIAAAVAMASLPQAPAPGKTMVAIGGGTYAGQSAMAVGVSTYAGRWVLKASGSTNSRGTVAAGFGAGYTW
ncbi:YadA-like family protein [Burkholderia glumae]|uniref:YadA-like family protein n=1 Tax=Burkholderia glumae TaxID=337 RepID=UPI0013203B27|nr:YadA-like family protein [Burkholderia glumae]QHE14259.1 ParB N-terminal domain-containing protein [Burkholderia glumae AU6208]